MFYTILLIIGCIILLMIVGCIIFLNTGLKLPAETDHLIKEIIDTPDSLPEFVTGQTGYAKNNGVSIWYELINNETTNKGTVLLVGGLSTTAMYWQPYIYEPFLNAGYQVIRFDQRNAGMSDWLETKSSLEDMAKDAIAILDQLNINKVHLVGMSMGGMISQRLAISHSKRILSLTSVMSTGYFHDPALTQVPKSFISNLWRFGLRHRNLKKMENKMKLHLSIQRLLTGDGGYFFDNKKMLQKIYYEITKRKGYNPKATNRHGYSIKKSGSRYEELKELSLPTLVIHGTTDPLILFEHAEKYAEMIPNSTKLFIKGMGHDFPRVHMDKMIVAIFENFEKA